MIGCWWCLYKIYRHVNKWKSVLVLKSYRQGRKLINIDNMSSNTVIKEQYKNTNNLKLRKSLHEKYSINRVGFQKWMFEQYPFRTKMKVLELGSGRGELWDYLKSTLVK